MTLPISVDPNGAVPPFEQVRTRIAELARSGELPPTTRLPTVRQLARDLGLAANTVARAYRELETDGVVETRGRNGTFVSASGDSAHREAVAAAHEFAQRAVRLGLSQSAALEVVRSAIRVRYAEQDGAD